MRRRAPLRPPPRRRPGSAASAGDALETASWSRCPPRSSSSTPRTASRSTSRSTRPSLRRGRRAPAGRSPPSSVARVLPDDAVLGAPAPRATYAGFRVVAYDQRGHGRSGEPALDRAPSPSSGGPRRGHRGDAPDGPVVLVGHSMGGMTSWRSPASTPTWCATASSPSPSSRPALAAPSMTEFALGPGRLLVGSLGPGVLPAVAPRGPAHRAQASGWAGGRGVPRGAVRVRLAGARRRRPARRRDDLRDATRRHGGVPPDIDDHDLAEGLAALDGIETLVMNGAGDPHPRPTHSEEIVRRSPAPSTSSSRTPATSSCSSTRSWSTSSCS